MDRSDGNEASDKLVRLNIVISNERGKNFAFCYHDEYEANHQNRKLESHGNHAKGEERPRVPSAGCSRRKRKVQGKLIAGNLRKGQMVRCDVSHAIDSSPKADGRADPPPVLPRPSPA